MGRFRLDHMLDFLTSTELFLGLLWAGLAALSITLLVLTRTRWGQSRPLRKCLLLSLLAHLLLAGYATTVQICSVGSQPEDESVMRVALTDAQTAPTDPGAVPPPPKPWEQLLHESVVEPEIADARRAPVEPRPDPHRRRAAARDVSPADIDLEHMPEPEAAEPISKPDPALLEPHERDKPSVRRPEPLEALKAKRREPILLSVPAKRPADRPKMATQREAPEREAPGGLPSELSGAPTLAPRVAHEADTTDPAQLIRDIADFPTPTPLGEPAQATAEPTVSGEGSSAGAPGRPEWPSRLAPSVKESVAAGPRESPDAEANVDPDPPQLVRIQPREKPHDVPEIYRLRLLPDRSRQAERRGATPQSEAAVQQGLKWLAANQEPDGRWRASRHGAGRETRVAGQDRHGAGVRADTGMTALALLSFLAAGHTHRQGPYRENVRKGLDFLLGAQRSDGSLQGKATSFAAMYCHSMATFALSEACALTGDARLEQPVRRAIGHIVAAQDRGGGGWRYTPGDPGDTSQLGWQLMALKSGELAGIPIPSSTRQRAVRFLASVSSGRNGGLASYRPKERITRPMTAEALYCRQLLGMPAGSPTAGEAADYLLGELPGEGPVNLYYWYYCTLALCPMQGDHWYRWNQALQKDLISRQCSSGTLSGSWDPATVWGGYGGRVYSTALATLCLEVYYRYLPLQAETAGEEKSLR